MIFRLAVENYYSLRFCAAARGPEIKDECILAVITIDSTIIKLVGLGFDGNIHGCGLAATLHLHFSSNRNTDQ